MAVPLNPLIEQFAKRVCARNSKTGNHWTITDEVFLLIEGDPKLMTEYQQLKSVYTKKTVNQQIGMVVKLHYGLTNDKSRENKPKSSLIKSHQRFK